MLKRKEEVWVNLFNISKKSLLQKGKEVIKDSLKITSVKWLIRKSGQKFSGWVGR